MEANCNTWLYMLYVYKLKCVLHLLWISKLIMRFVIVLYSILVKYTFMLYINHVQLHNHDQLG